MTRRQGAGVLVLFMAAAMAHADPYELITAKGLYAKGEAVKLKFRNNSPKAVTLKNEGSGIYHNNKLVYTPKIDLLNVMVGPGQEHPAASWWTWYQVDDALKVAPAGKYLVRLNLIKQGEDENVTVETSFVITKSMGLALTTDQPVYKSDVAGPVKITVRNDSSQIVHFGNSAPWKVLKGTQYIYTPPSQSVLLPLAPGQSKTFVWDKKRKNGNYANPGSYLIKAGPIILNGGVTETLTCTIAMTPTGNLGGTGYFPIDGGNRWVYHPLGPAPTGYPEEMKVTLQDADGNSTDGSWLNIMSLVGADRRAKLSGTTLYVAPASASIWKELFHFNRPLNYTYEISVEPYLPNAKIKVGALNETVEAPAGIFKGCYRLDVVSSSLADAGYGPFWFARGIGLVQYSKIWEGGSTKYGLYFASIKVSSNVGHLRIGHE